LGALKSTVGMFGASAFFNSDLKRGPRKKSRKKSGWSVAPEKISLKIQFSMKMPLLGLNSLGVEGFGGEGAGRWGGDI